AEDSLLALHLPPAEGSDAVKPVEYEVFAGLNPAQRAVVSARLERRTYKKGEPIIIAGAPATELFLLTSGRVNVVVALPSGAKRRLATFSAGMVFGEMAVIDRSPRSANIIA